MLPTTAINAPKFTTVTNILLCEFFARQQYGFADQFVVRSDQSDDVRSVLASCAALCLAAVACAPNTLRNNFRQSGFPYTWQALS